MSQATLDGGPASGAGLWRSVLDGDAVDHGKWLRVCSEGGFVGTCTCGDYLVPVRPYEVAGRFDYLATCRRESCAHELLSPGGRVLRRSARLSERPR